MRYPLKIVIEAIPHADHRTINGEKYETCGDYFWYDGTLHIRVSEVPEHADYSLPVIVHELVEALLCHERGIHSAVIDRFDMQFEAKREEGNTDEPGDDPSAPYHDEHVFATIIERLVARELGIEWSGYEKAVNNLGAE